MPRKKQAENESANELDQLKEDNNKVSASLEMAKKLFPTKEELLSSINQEQNIKNYEDESVSYHDIEDAGKEDKKEIKEVKKERKFNSIEQEALKQGWRPLEEYEGDPTNWKDAESFVNDGHFWELRRQISDLRNIISNQQEALQLLTSDVTQRSEEKIDSLKMARREAILNGDADKVDEFDKIIESLSSKKTEVKSNQSNYSDHDSSQPSLEIKEFAERNKWWFNPKIKKGEPYLNGGIHKYDGNFYMQIADAAYMQYKKDNPYLNEREILFEVERSIKKDYFPELLPQNRAAPVHKGGINRSNNRRETNYDDLPDSIYDPMLQKTFNPKQVIDSFMNKAEQMLSKSKHKPKLSKDKDWYANFLKENYLSKQ